MMVYATEQSIGVVPMDVKNAKEVILALGGETFASIKLSEILGRRVPISTVGAWKRRGKFPFPWECIIQKHAADLGLCEK